MTCLEIKYLVSFDSLILESRPNATTAIALGEMLGEKLKMLTRDGSFLLCSAKSQQREMYFFSIEANTCRDRGKYHLNKEVSDIFLKNCDIGHL